MNQSSFSSNSYSKNAGKTTIYIIAGLFLNIIARKVERSKRLDEKEALEREAIAEQFNEYLHGVSKNSYNLTETTPKHLKYT